MERRKIWEREFLTYEDKVEIAQKSDDRCCHCGKLVYTNYGATVDHFIPLYKGGTNRWINLIMLCEDCNKKKDDKIMDITYCKYLKPKYQKELNGYLDSYIKSFDYINRNYMFACDEYTIFQQYGLENRILKKNKKVQAMVRNMGQKYIFKRATWDDFSKLCEYFKKYCKKYDCFGSDDAVKVNIGFWLQFGAIYYLERNNEISLMTVFTIKHMTEMDRYNNLESVLNMYCFSYYSSETAFTLIVNAVTELTRFILNEQGLAFMPVNFTMLGEDKLFSSVAAYLTRGSMKGVGNSINGFSTVSCVVLSKDKYKETGGVSLDCITEEDTAKLAKFFSKFSPVNDDVREYFKNNSDSNWADWMLYDILSPEDIADLDILDNLTAVKEYNDKYLAAAAKWQAKQEFMKK